MNFQNLKWIAYDNAFNTLPKASDASPLSMLEKFKKQIKRENRSILFKKTFYINEAFSDASISVCGLGIYRLYINGKAINPESFSPLITEYDKRILYDVFDVKDYLVCGENIICAEVAGGYFSPPPKYWGWRMVWLGNPKMALCLGCTLASGENYTVKTDETWVSAKGGITENCIYDGISRDLRIYNNLEWKKASLTESPCDIMEENTYPAVKVCERYLPDFIKSINTHTAIYGFPYNKTGYIKIGVMGKCGDSISLHHAERMNDNDIDPTSNRLAENTDTYILADDGITYLEPHFSYRGFRYVKCTKSSPNMEIVFIEQCALRSEMVHTSDFQCDNDDLNKIHNACVMTLENAYFGMPLDCSQRDERLAWYGDAHVTSETNMYNFDMRGFYKKCFDDIRYGCGKNGEVPLISPRSVLEHSTDFSGGYPIILMQYLKHYNDKTIISNHFRHIMDYINFLVTESDDLFLPRGRYGDWSSCEEGFTRGYPAYSDTMFFCYIMMIGKYFAEILGKEDEAAKLASLYENLKNKLKSAYYSNKIFGDGSVFSTSFALLLGLIDDKDEKDVVLYLENKIIKRNYKLYTGIFGTKFALEVLFKYKCYETLEKVILNNEFPGWLYMLENSTTLTERWDGVSDSLNHGMFGSIDAFLYKMYAGIIIDHTKDIPLEISPYFEGSCNYVSACANKGDDIVRVKWFRKENIITMIITCPDINAKINLQSLKYKSAQINEVPFDISANLICGLNKVFIEL